MKSRVLGAALFLAACGGGSSGSGSTGASGNTYAITIDVSGSGAVSSGGEVCRGHCVWQVPMGATLHIDSAADSGWQFAGWSNSSCGAASCDLTLTGDLSLTATFTQLAATSFTLTVSMNGTGSVSSQPNGISCPQTCSATFPAGTNITLTSTVTGGAFDGFGGGCSGTNCSLTLNANTIVYATFEPATVTLPPTPPACAKLMPASVPSPVIPPMDCSGSVCNTGTSDDGSGTFALLSGREVEMFSVSNGVATQTANDTFTSSISLFSEPSGFGVFDGSSVYNYSRNGTSRTTTTLGGVESVASDPNGGYVVISAEPVVAGSDQFSFRLQRFDKTGALVADNPSFYSGSPGYILVGLGVTLEDHTLALFTTPTGDMGIWVDQNATPIGTEFSAAPGALQFMLDGSLLEHGGPFTQVWRDGANTPTQLPPWLSSRANATWIYPIAEGTGYAMAGTCSGIEVLTTSGDSCGCVAVPGVSSTTSIGRDGSLIVPRGDHYELYPLLFHGT